MIRVTLSVFVLASPTIKLLVEDPIVANPGQTVVLVCIISGGEPTPTLTWVRNNEELPKKSNLNSETLTIPAISTEDAGVYSCVANNNVGNPAKKSTNIVVRGEKRGFEALLVLFVCARCIIVSVSFWKLVVCRRCK